ncbi:MAG: TlyA family rRNA (cytidine-2'-O)-methyltransferase [Rhodospirillaceae bacterium]|nr:TlyA family rRNA (cytidine-2'-O)-methyltransferase [Rhodospirillaceae bacterium]
MASKSRLDSLLVSRGLAENRTRAQALILSGVVFSEGNRLDKPGYKISEGALINVRMKKSQWVSRGGEKLFHALNHFDLPVNGLHCLDIGSSTGGFTEVLLQKGAAHVDSVDVGRGQLDWNLRNNERVKVLEGINARYLTRDQISTKPHVVVCDASFIGLRTLLPAALTLAEASAFLIALIKPQFEVGKGRVGKGGVVRDPDLHIEVCQNIEHWLVEEMGWHVHETIESTLQGPKGNKEFFICAQNTASNHDTDLWGKQPS